MTCYFTYFTARYQAFPNVIWDYSKESYYELDKDYLASRLALVKENDSYRRLTTVHDDRHFYGEPQNAGLLDFATLQQHDDFYTSALLERSKRRLADLQLGVWLRERAGRAGRLLRLVKQHGRGLHRSRLPGGHGRGVHRLLLQLHGLEHHRLQLHATRLQALQDPARLLHVDSHGGNSSRAATTCATTAHCAWHAATMSSLCTRGPAAAPICRTIFSAGHSAVSG